VLVYEIKYLCFAGMIMNTRRFYFYTTLIITGFLFFTGIIMLNFINASSDAYAFNDSGSLLDNILNDFKNTNEPINILVLGGDKVNQNSDTMILVNYDPSTAKISMLSIPRDTKVKIDGTNRKINYAFPHGGPALAAQTVSKLLDVKIKYYVYIDTKAFREIIDLLGGVDYYVPADMNYDDPIQNLHIHLTKGMQHMDGEMAEQFMRFRDPNKWTKELKKYYDGSDLKRIDAQQSFIKELIKQKMKLYNITKIKDIINTVFDNIETNIELDDAIKLSSGIAKINTDELNMMTLPGTTYDGSPCTSSVTMKQPGSLQKCISRLMTALYMYLQILMIIQPMTANKQKSLQIQRKALPPKIHQTAILR
jgi:LCP family protein required for cell wall assembly